MEANKNKFVVQYRPGYVGPSGKKAQQVSFKMSDYKETGQTRVMSMWESQFNNMMSCVNTSATKETKTDKPIPCKKPDCKVIARGTYSAGFDHGSNPVVFEFNARKSKPNLVWKGDIVGGQIVKITRISCDEKLSKFKV
jgi:hypothetical protein